MEVQRSVDGSNFTTIALLKGRSGLNNRYELLIEDIAIPKKGTIVSLNIPDRLPERIYTVMFESEGQLLVQKLSLRK